THRAAVATLGELSPHSTTQPVMKFESEVHSGSPGAPASAGSPGCFTGSEVFEAEQPAMATTTTVTPTQDRTHSTITAPHVRKHRGERAALGRVLRSATD